MKFDLKEKVRKQRMEGKSINNIAKEFSLSKSTVSLWVRDIILTKEQKEHLTSFKKYNFSKEVDLKRKNDALILRRQYQEEGKIKAKEKDLLHCIGSMLFWAEGNKDKNSIIFSNTDINMMKIFVKFLKERLQVDNSDISFSVNCFLHEEKDINQVHEWWINQLSIEGCKICKPAIKITTQEIDNFGVCRLAIYNTQKADTTSSNDSLNSFEIVVASTLG